MPGRPPNARPGKRGASSGRPIVAGVAPHVRVLSGRATTADLWASLDALAARSNGLDGLHRRPHDKKAKDRFSAYIHQAKEYFEAVRPAEPVAKPLLAYYFALNLSKAFLTAVEPATTADKLRHGVSPVSITSQRYRFTQEAFRVQARGVFRLVAEHTGQCFAGQGDERSSSRRWWPFYPRQPIFMRMPMETIRA
ncbi:MAG: YaaC family protein [Acidimicrobiia bacterium]